MLKMVSAIATLTIALASAAQNANTSAQATRRRVSTNANTAAQATSPAAPTSAVEGGAQEEGAAAKGTRGRRRRTGTQTEGGANDATSRGVVAAFNSLLDGIRAANVEKVAAAYWNSPQLILFNHNGTVTKGWEQMRQNRATSYPNIKDVKLDVRDVRVQMLGRDGAVVTCLWTQSQTVRGTPETATGRMTLVFRRLGDAWKAIHLHTSPQEPDPSRVLPSERTPPAAATTPSPTPSATP